MRLIDADALMADIEKTIEDSGCVNHEGEILDCVACAPTINDRVDDERFKAALKKIIQLSCESVEREKALARLEAEFIEELHCKLTLAERVCYTAKGYLAHKDDPLGGVYLDHLKNTLQLWEKR